MTHPQPSIPQPYVVNPSTPRTHTIMLLHGWQSNGRRFADEFLRGKTTGGETLLEHFSRSGARLVFPTGSTPTESPYPEVTKDEQFFAWYDPRGIELQQIQDLRRHIRYISFGVEEELKHVSRDKLFLGGFCQGFCVAMHTLFRGRYQLGGFIGLSGWVLFTDRVSRLAEPVVEGLHEFYKVELKIPAETTLATLRTPVYMAHSSHDVAVPIGYSKSARDVLQKLSMDVTWKEYDSEDHWLKAPDGYNDFKQWIDGIMKARKDEAKGMEPL